MEIIIFRNVFKVALIRISETIEEAMICQECHVRDDTTLELVRPDFGMMIAVNFNNFIISAFEQENCNLQIDRDNFET